MSATAQVVRELHRIHQQRSDLEDRLQRGPKQLRARELNLARLQTALSESQEQYKSIRMASDQKQLQLKTGEQKIEDLRAKLNACGSNREYQALKEQIAADEMANSVFADEILESLDKIDEAAAHVKTAETELATAEAELNQTREEVARQQDLLESELQRVNGNLTEAETNLPVELRDVYRRMVTSKGADAMAAADGTHCGGCYQALTPNIHTILQAGEVQQCLTCGRLLYLPEDVASESH
jgi:predicted  nucleic acid-binding Zn-ribbon protein